MNTIKNIKDFAKASTCAVVAGTTALAGGMTAPANAFASIVDDSDYGIIDAKETTALPTPELAKAMLDQAQAEASSANAAYNKASSDYEVSKIAHAAAASNSESSVKNAEAAQKQVTDLISSMQTSSSSALNDATAQANAYQASYDEAVKNRNAADAAYQEAEKKYEDAKMAYENALSDANRVSAEDQKAVETANTQVSNAKEEAQKASDAVAAAESVLSEKTAARVSAENALAAAKATQTAKSNALSAAKTEAANAQTTLNAIEESDDIATAQTAVNNANAKVTQLESEKAAIDGKIEQANYDYAKALADEISAKNNLADAKAALESLTASSSQLSVETPSVLDVFDDSAVEDAAVTLAEAKAAWDVAKDTLEQAEKNLSDTESAFEDSEAELLEAGKALIECDNIVYNVYDFFRTVANSDLVYAEIQCRWNRIGEETHWGEADDASSHFNVLRALQTIRDLNAVRQSIGITNDLLVSDQLMVRSILSCNWSAFYRDHSYDCGFENLALDWSDNPVSGWYDYEKAIYDHAVLTNKCLIPGQTSEPIALPENWQSMSRNELKEVCPVFHQYTGHYLNCINPNFRFIGAAYHVGSGAKAETYEQSYGIYAQQGDVVMTVDAWEARFKEWVESMRSANPDVIKAQSAYDLALSIKNEARIKVAQEKLAIADAMVKEAQSRAAYYKIQLEVEFPALVDENSGELDSAKAEFAYWNDALDKAKNAKSDAEKALLEANAAVNTAQQDVDSADAAVETAMSNKEMAVAEENSAQAEASAKTSALKIANSAVFDAEKVLDAAKSTAEAHEQEASADIQPKYAAMTSQQSVATDTKNLYDEKASVASGISSELAVSKSQVDRFNKIIAELDKVTDGDESADLSDDFFVELVSALNKSREMTLKASDAVTAADVAASKMERDAAVKEAAHKTYLDAVARLTSAQMTYEQALEAAKAPVIGDIDDPSDGSDVDDTNKGDDNADDIGNVGNGSNAGYGGNTGITDNGANDGSSSNAGNSGANTGSGTGANNASNTGSNAYDVVVGDAELVNDASDTGVGNEASVSRYFGDLPSVSYSAATDRLSYQFPFIDENAVDEEGIVDNENPLVTFDSVIEEGAADTSASPLPAEGLGVLAVTAVVAGAVARRIRRPQHANDPATSIEDSNIAL